jgi:hypothetical protein
MTDRRFSLLSRMMSRARLSPVDIVVPVAKLCAQGFRGKYGRDAE